MPWIAAGGGGTESPLTTKGDLYTFDSDNARLPVGDDGHVLTADSGEATGLKWAPAAGGSGSGSYSETIGDNSNTSYQVEHGLGTEDIVVQLWDLTGSDPVEATGDAASITVDDDDTITVAFSAPPAVDSYRVVVLSDGGTGSGGGGGSISDPLYERGDSSSPHADDDEFDVDGSGVPAGWTAVQDSTPRYSFATRFGKLHYYAQGAISNAEDFEGLLKPIPGTPSPPLTIEATILQSPEMRNYPMAGVVFADGTTWGSGTQIFAGTYTDGGNTMLTHRTMANWNGVGGGWEQAVTREWVFVRLVWTAANTFRVLFSSNGVTWKRLDTSEAINYSLNPTHYGLTFSPWASNSNEPVHGAIHCFRVYASAKDEGID